MNKDTVKQAIIKKFGKLSRFADLSEEDEYTLRKLFARKNPDKKELSRISKLVKSTDATSTGDEISNEDRMFLKEQIELVGGVIKFCNENDFSRDSVFQILSGKRKRMTDKARELFSFFSAEYS